jgi:hypothetical protein
MKALSALMDFFIPTSAGKKPPVPKYTLVADPTNKRGSFGKGPKTRPTPSGRSTPRSSPTAGPNTPAACSRARRRSSTPATGRTGSKG